jgi:hypothetical protein
MPLVRIPEPFDHPDWLFELKHDGFRALTHVEGEGLTAIASDPNEAEPGPIVVQGDHGSVEFRKVHIDAAREGWRKSVNNALSLSLMGLPL